jgi:hypothetical protein
MKSVSSKTTLNALDSAALVFSGAQLRKRRHHCSRGKRKQHICSLDIRQVLLDRDVMHPGLHGRVEKLQPFITNMEHQGVAQEQMLEAKTGGHTSEVEKISGNKDMYRFNASCVI